MMFSEEVLGAIIGGVITAVITLASAYAYRQRTSKEKEELKESKENEIKKNLAIWQNQIDNKLETILRIRDEVNTTNSRCANFHLDYNSRFDHLTHRDDMAKSDIDRILSELSNTNYSLQQLRDSNLQLAEKVQKILELNQMKNEEQDKKIETLFKKMDKEK